MIASAIQESTTKVPKELTCMTFWKNCQYVRTKFTGSERVVVTHGNAVF